MQLATAFAAPDEVGALLELSLEDPRLILDLHFPRQHVNQTACSMDPEHIGEIYESLTLDRDLPGHLTRSGWWHHHPFESCNPSGTDINTFNEEFGSGPIAMMLISQKDFAKFYCRFRVSTLNASITTELPVEVDWSLLSSSDYSSLSALKEALPKLVERKAFPTYGKTKEELQRSQSYITYHTGGTDGGGSTGESPFSYGRATPIPSTNRIGAIELLKRGNPRGKEGGKEGGKDLKPFTNRLRNVGLNFSTIRSPLSMEETRCIIHAIQRFDPTWEPFQDIRHFGQFLTCRLQPRDLGNINKALVLMNLPMLGEIFFPWFEHLSVIEQSFSGKEYRAQMKEHMKQYGALLTSWMERQEALISERKKQDGTSYPVRGAVFPLPSD